MRACAGKVGPTSECCKPGRTNRPSDTFISNHSIVLIKSHSTALLLYCTVCRRQAVPNSHPQSTLRIVLIRETHVIGVITALKDRLTRQLSSDRVTTAILVTTR